MATPREDRQFAASQDWCEVVEMYGNPITITRDIDPIRREAKWQEALTK